MNFQETSEKEVSVRKTCQSTCIKEPWTKPKGVELRVGGGWGDKVVVGKWRQLYSKNLKVIKILKRSKKKERLTLSYMKPRKQSYND